MRTRPAVRSVAVAAVALASLTLAGCGNGEEPVCSAVDALQASIADVTDVNLDQDALAKLQDNLAEVRDDLSEVRSEAEDEFATELDDVDKAAASLGLALDFALSSPSAETVADVAPAVQQLGSALSDLVTAVNDSC